MVCVVLCAVVSRCISCRRIGFTLPILVGMRKQDLNQIMKLEIFGSSFCHLEGCSHLVVKYVVVLCSLLGVFFFFKSLLGVLIRVTVCGFV